MSDAALMSDITPAYHRDLEDRPLFILNDKYYYIDEESGFFVESDFVLETDGRGLAFDYNPDYGKSTNSIKIYHTVQEITMKYKMDTANNYTRPGVDYRIAREMYEQFPEYAANIEKAGTNAAFSVFLAKAKGNWHGVTVT